MGQRGQRSIPALRNPLELREFRVGQHDGDPVLPGVPGRALPRSPRSARTRTRSPPAGFLVSRHRRVPLGLWAALSPRTASTASIPARSYPGSRLIGNEVGSGKTKSHSGGFAGDRPRAGQSMSSPRSRLRLLSRLRWRLASSRRAFEFRVGAVGRRVGARWSAASTSSRSRSRAMARFRARLRWRSACTIRTPSRDSLGRRRAINSRRTSGRIPRVSRTFHRSVTRVLAVLTCWPPGPPERLASSSISPPGIRLPPERSRSASRSRAPRSVMILSDSARDVSPHVPFGVRPFELQTPRVPVDSTGRPDPS